MFRTNRKYGYRKRLISVFLVMAVMLSFAVPFSIPVSADEVPATDDEIYARIYKIDPSKGNSRNLEMVYQKGSDIDESRVLVGQYDHFADGSQLESVLIPGSKRDYRQPWYDYNDELVKITIRDKIAPTNMAGWFMYVRHVPDDQFINIDNIDTSQCTTFYCLFNYAQFEELDLTCWDVSNIKTMSGMFSHQNGAGLQKLNISNWDVSNVNGSFAAFIYDSAIEEIDISSFNPVKCSSFSGMFEANKNLKRVKIGDFHTYSNCIFSSMFKDCTSLESVYSTEPVEGVADLSSITSANARMFGRMFRNCKLIEYIDFGENITAKASPDNDSTKPDNYMFENTFEGCESLKTVNLSCATSAIISDSTFKGCTSLKEINLGNLGQTPKSVASNLSGRANIFEGCDELSYITLGENWPLAGLAGTSIPSKTTWKKVAGAGGVAIGTILPNTELFGNFNKNYAGTWAADSKITLNANGGTPKYQMIDGPKGIDASYDENITATKTGYEFDGWYTGKTDGNKLENGEPIEAWVYYAHWNENTYDLILDGNGGSVPAGMTFEGGTISQDRTQVTFSGLRYTEFKSLTSSMFSMDDGSVLASWNIRPNGTDKEFAATDSVNKLTAMNGDTATLYAQWYTPEAVIEFDPQGGTDIADKNYDIGDRYGLLPSPTKAGDNTYPAGYTFMGWYTEPNGQGYEIVDLDDEDLDNTKQQNKVTQSRTLYAYWKPTCAVTFDANGGEVDGDAVAVKIIMYNQTLGKLPVPENASAAFLGWYTQEDGGSRVTNEIVITDPAITYYAHWGYKPVFETDGGSFTDYPQHGYPVQAESRYDFSSYSVDLPTVTKHNCTFLGWYSDEDGNGTYETRVDTNTPVELLHNSVIKAMWREDRKCTVTLDPDGGTIDSGEFSITVYQGKPVAELPTPTKAGYDFEGWYDTNNNKYTAETIVNDDISLTARWAAKQCTLTFDANGGTLYDPVNATMEIASGKTIPAIPGVNRKESDGTVRYFFGGWYPNADGTGEKLTRDTVITSDATYYAKWVEPENCVLINDSGSTDMNNRLYMYSVNWGTLSDGNVTNNTGDNLVFHPMSNGNISGMLRIQFHTYDNSNSTDIVIPKNAVKIRIPKYIFKDRSGNPIGTDNINVGLSNKPSANADFYYTVVTENGEEFYELTNNVELKGKHSDFKIFYEADPNEMEGGYIDENGYYQYLENKKFFENNIQVKINVNLNEGDGEGQDHDCSDAKELDYTKDLSLEVHTRVNTNVSKMQTAVSMKWDSRNWGVEPPDADEYYYVTWKLISNHSGSTQPFSLSWSEDTVRDGAIVVEPVNSDADRTNGSYSTTVVTKHRRDSVYRDENGWATAHNEAVLSVRWKSGYVQNYRAAAEAYAYLEDPNASGGGNEFRKFNKTIENDPSTASNHYKNGGQELIQINQPISLVYKISYSEIKRETEPVWHSGSGTYTAPERTITITDGDPGDLVIAQHSKNPLPSESEWNAARDVRLNESDYYFDKLVISIKEYDSIKMNETWSNPFEHENENDYSDKGIVIRIRRAGKTEIETLSPIVHSASQTVDLPNDTVWFSVQYSSNFYSTDISVNPTVCLKTTNHIKSLVQDHIEANKNSIIKNKSKVTVEQPNEETLTMYTGEEGKSGWVSSYVLNIGESNLYAVKNCADDHHLDYDNDNAIEFLPMIISGFGYNTTGNKKPMKSGEFYDLLPEGYAVDKSSVFVNLRSDNTESAGRNANNYYTEKDKSGHLPAAYYSVKFDENWNNTGRTMMTVSVSTPEDTISTGFDVYYMMNTTFANVMINGQNPENMMAFKDTTPGQSVPVERRGTITTIEQKYRTSFEFADSNQTAYDQEPINAVSPAYIASGLTSTVKTEGAVTSNHQIIGRNTDYTYTVTYRNDENYTSKDLVLFDLIERKVGGSSSEWFGSFESIDVSTIQKKRVSDGVYCNPVVYYSTKENFAESELDVSNTSVWTTVMPPKEQITAVAVDCRKTTAGEDFILGKKDGLSFDISMHSPGDTDNDLTAYNEAYVRGNFVNLDTKVDNVTQTRVTIHYNIPQFVKSAFPASGTVDNPDSVVKNSVIEYVLRITNPDSDVAMLNVKVEDILCNKVRVNNSIMVQVNEEEAVSIDNTPLVSYSITDADGGATRFSATIESIEANQTISIFIPAKVIADKSDDPEENKITNRADILSVNDIPYENPVESNPTYHKIDEIKAKVLKTNSKGVPLAGAKLSILDKDKNPVPIAYDENDEPIYEFTSTDEVLSFNLDKGTYYLHEAADGVPEDFKKADDVQFRIDIEGIIYVNNQPVNYVEMKDEPDYKVIFHENNPELEDKNVVFRTYEPNELNEDKSIDHFYDIPEWAGDEYVFAGWYHNDGYTETPVGAETAVDFDSSDRDTYPKPTPVRDYHIYAMWIKVDTVSKDSKDQNIADTYRGFGLKGVQIRTGNSIQRMLDEGIIPANETDFYKNNLPGNDNNFDMEDPNFGGNTQPGGLRFVTSIREGLLTDIYNIDKIDATPEEGKNFGVEYGYVVGTYDNLQTFFDHYSTESRLDYTLQYKGENVNGLDTTQKTSLYNNYGYITNVNCTSNQKIGGKQNSGVVERDHRNFSDYRLYTLIVTYEGDDIQNVDKKIDARAYMRYYDANGKLRVFYNTYSPSKYYGGCMCSFKQALDISIGKTQHDMLEQ